MQLRLAAGVQFQLTAVPKERTGNNVMPFPDSTVSEAWSETVKLFGKTDKLVTIKTHRAPKFTPGKTLKRQVVR